MTTVSEVLEGQFRPDASAGDGSEGARTRARVRARLAATDGDGKSSRLAAALARAAHTAVSDVAGAWPWRGTPPTLAELVAVRVPDRDRVPGRNLALWASWVVFNHVMLPVFAVAYPVLWVLAHPARFVLAAVLAVLARIWI